MLKIAVTGATGLVGSRILELLQNEYEFISLDQDQMDITKPNQVQKKLQDTDYDLLIHLAAYTDVDSAETHQQLASKVNVFGTKNVFETVQKQKKKMIFISTDFVFDGRNPFYDENSTPQPIEYYGQTKFQAEQLLKNKAMIVRISYPYRANFSLKKDFVRSIKSLLKNNQIIHGINDSFITPTFVDDIALGLKYLITQFDTKIYHLVGQDSLTPFQAFQQIATIFNLDSSFIRPVSYQEYFKDKALRPKAAIIKSLNNNFYPMHTFKQGLEIIKEQLKKGN